jgi:glycerophosphoryl diester phosphodiesterase
MRSKRWLMMWLACAASSASCRGEDPPKAFSVPPGVLVAHALGGIGGYPYTNSLEAFECNYARGFRWFEVDLALTSDGELVCFHPGNESLAGLPKPIGQLTMAELVGKRYAGRYPLRRFAELLSATEAAGDVVLVTDTKTWSAPMLETFQRAALAAAPRRTRFALQSYGEQDIANVKAVAAAVHGEVLLTLYMSGADDEQVEQLVKAHGVMAVVADMRRFTPWLADRLHHLGVPVLVHTINDHRDVARLARAGADGFYTDDYRPYATGAPASATMADCAYAGDLAIDAAEWLERDLLRPGDYLLSGCAKRTFNGVELHGCGSEAAVTGPNLAVPPGRALHVELDIEADADGSELWLTLIEKNRPQPARPREGIRLAPGERRVFTYDMALPAGSPGIEARLGLSSPSDRALVFRLNISHRELRAAAGVVAYTSSAPPSSP